MLWHVYLNLSAKVNAGILKGVLSLTVQPSAMVPPIIMLRGGAHRRQYFWPEICFHHYEKISFTFY